MTEPPIRVRPARAADLAAIVALLADDALGRDREALGPPLDPAYAEAFAAITADPNQLLVVAEDDTGIVGTLQLSFIPGLSHKGAWRAEIEAVRIASARRGGGLGKRLIAWAIEAARARGCRLVQLTTDARRHDAHRFYESLGFVPSHRGYKLAL